MKKVLLLVFLVLFLATVSWGIEMVRQKNAATYIFFPMIDADGDIVTSAAGLDSETDTWGDGAAPDGFADLDNEATEIGSDGWYYISLTQAEMNHDYIAIQIKTSTEGAKTQHILIRTITGDPLLLATTAAFDSVNNAIHADNKVNFMADVEDIRGSVEPTLNRLNIYMDTGGNGDNDGLTWATAVCSLRIAERKCTGADEYFIYVAPGNYSDQCCTVDVANLTIEGAGWDRTILNGTTGASIIHVEHAGRGFKVSGLSFIHDTNSRGIYLRDIEGFEISDCYFEKCYMGIFDYVTGEKGRINDVFIYASAYDGVRVDGDKVWIDHIVVDSLSETGGDGIALLGKYCTASNNIVKTTKGHCLIGRTSTYGDNAFVNNCLWHPDSDSLHHNIDYSQMVGNREKSKIASSNTLEDDINQSPRSANSDSGYTAGRASNLDNLDVAVSHARDSAHVANTNVLLVKAKTDNLPTDPADDSDLDAQLSAMQTDLDNPSQYKANLDSIENAIKDDNKSNFKAIGFATAESVHTAIADANKPNFKATGFATSSDFDSVENAIADANKANFKATGFAVAGDEMTLQDDSLYTLMTDVDGIKNKTDNLPDDPADDSDIDVQLSSIQSDLNSPDQYKASLDSTENAIADANKANFKATGFATSTQGDSVTGAITDVNKANFKYSGGEDSVRAFLAKHDSTLLEQAAGGASNWSDAQRDSILNTILDANKPNFMANLDSINSAVADANKPNFKATGYATADSVHGAIADANKVNFKASLDSVNNAITDVNKANFKYAGGEDSVRAYLATHDSTLLELASGGASNWSNAQRDSVLTTILDANKINFQATGFAAPGDAMTFADDSLNILMTDIDGIKTKTDNLPTDPADDSDIDAQLSAVQLDLDSPAQYKATGFAVMGDPMTLQNDSLNTLMGDIDDIKAKTDNLPTDPADDSDIDGQLATIAGYLDADSSDGIDPIIKEIRQIATDVKDKTDNLPSDPADDSDIDSQLGSIQTDLNNPAQYKATGFATSTQGDSITNAIADANKPNFYTWSTTQRDSILNTVEDVNKANYKATGFATSSDGDSIIQAIADANKPNFYNWTNAQRDSVLNTILDANKVNYMRWAVAQRDSILNTIADANKANFKATGFATSTDGDSIIQAIADVNKPNFYNWADAQRDSVLNTIEDANKVNYMRWTNAQRDSVLNTIEDANKVNFMADLDSVLNAIADANKPNFMADLDSILQAIADANKPNFHSDGDTNTNPFDASSDKVTLEDSSAEDISYVKNHPDDFKATGFSTFDPSSDSVIAKYCDTTRVVGNAGSDTTVIKTMFNRNIRPWVWYADTTTWHDSTGTMGELLGTAIAEAADVDSESIGRTVWNNAIIALANRTVTPTISAGVGSKQIKIKAYEADVDSTACDNCEVQIYLVEDSDYSDQKTANYTSNSGWSSVLSVDPDSYRVLVIDEDWSFDVETLSVLDEVGLQSFYITGTHHEIPAPESDSTTVIYGYVKDAGGNYVQDAIVTIKLDMRTPIVPTWTGSNDIVITELVDTTDASGAWDKEVVPNEYVSPSGTRYIIIYEKEGVILEVWRLIVIVPYSATPLNINDL